MPFRPFFLFFLVVALTQFGFEYEYGEKFTPAKVSEKERIEAERTKRELLQLEDLEIGDGPVAAWNRKIQADLEVRSADGSLIFKGPVFHYAGFKNMPDTSVYDKRHLGTSQIGINLGLNGMAVGGRRRMVIDPGMVCPYLDEYSPPGSTCYLMAVGPGSLGTRVPKKQLIVEATLTESCIPIWLGVFIWPFNGSWDIACRDQKGPRPDSKAPIWKFY